MNLRQRYLLVNICSDAIHLVLLKENIELDQYINLLKLDFSTFGMFSIWGC